MQSQSTGTPSKAERRWMDWCLGQGCVCCAKPLAARPGYFNPVCEIHHIVEANQRLGHLATLPLCAWHHRHSPEARHVNKAVFERCFGTEMAMLVELQLRYLDEFPDQQIFMPKPSKIVARRPLFGLPS